MDLGGKKNRAPGARGRADDNALYLSRAPAPVCARTWRIFLRVTAGRDCGRGVRRTRKFGRCVYVLVPGLRVLGWQRKHRRLARHQSQLQLRGMHQKSKTNNNNHNDNINNDNNKKNQTNLHNNRFDGCIPNRYNMNDGEIGFPNRVVSPPPHFVCYDF